MWKDEEDWSSHGNCIEGKCYCDYGWFDDDCGTNGDWGLGWTLYIYFSATAYIILWIGAIAQFRKLVRHEKIYGCSRVTKRVFKSPK